MSETEMAALRALLTSRPRPKTVAERRERLDALGLHTARPRTSASNR